MRAAREGALLVLADQKDERSRETLSELKQITEQGEGGGIVSGKTASPQNRVAAADEVSDIILFLASEETSNVTGVFMPVEGGFTAY